MGKMASQVELEGNNHRLFLARTCPKAAGRQGFDHFPELCLTAHVDVVSLCQFDADTSMVRLSVDPDPPVQGGVAADHPVCPLEPEPEMRLRVDENFKHSGHGNPSGLLTVRKMRATDAGGPPFQVTRRRRTSSGS
jgi:hypothetical protein